MYHLEVQNGIVQTKDAETTSEQDYICSVQCTLYTFLIVLSENTNHRH